MASRAGVGDVFAAVQSHADWATASADAPARTLLRGSQEGVGTLLRRKWLASESSCR
jgi:hypothetical protein